MFEYTLNYFYQSLAESIKERKLVLKLIRDDILKEPTRVSNIINGKCDKNHPYLIGKIPEYNYLYDLYKYNDKETFLEKSFDTLNPNEEINKKQNYDKMLWGHIDWNNMFKCIISELSTMKITEELGELFEKALVDDVYYANIKPGVENEHYGKIYHFECEVEKAREHAIEWVFLRHGCEQFKMLFLNQFSGEILFKCDKRLEKVIHDYLLKKQPKPSSLGTLAIHVRENRSHYGAVLQSSDKYKYIEEGTEFTVEAQALDKYVRAVNDFLCLLEKSQKEIYDIFYNNNTDEFEESPKILLNGE